MGAVPVIGHKMQMPPMPKKDDMRGQAAPAAEDIEPGIGKPMHKAEGHQLPGKSFYDSCRKEFKTSRHRRNIFHQLALALPVTRSMPITRSAMEHQAKASKRRLLSSPRLLHARPAISLTLPS